MADAISAVSNVQLGLLQSPEIAREQIPITSQSQIASAQAGAIVAREDRAAAEMVQPLEEPEGRGVRDSLGAPHERGERRSSRRAARGRLAVPAAARAIPLAAAHPRGLGSTVDIRA